MKPTRTLGRREFLKTATRVAATVVACVGMTPAAALTQTPEQSPRTIPTRTLGKTGLKRAIHQRQGLSHVLEPWIAGDGLELLPQFGDDFLQPCGLKDLLGFAQRTE